MKSYSLAHLADRTLLRDLAALVDRDRATTAELLAHIAEVDARELYLPAAYPSMYHYCVGELRLSEQAAYKRILVARVARRFPVVFEAVALGRLHLSSVVQLAPHLSEETADDLLAAATHKSKSEIERLLAERFPKPDVPTRLEAITPTGVAGQQAPAGLQLSPGIVAGIAPGPAETASMLASPPPPSHAENDGPLVPEPVDSRSGRAKLAPLAAGHFALQVTIGQGVHDKLRYAQELLGHVVAPGDVAEVLDRALDALIHRLERRRFAATAKPRPRSSQASGRYVPAEVRREVWRRDGGRCTFVSDRGQRCPARTRLELDHVEPVARGGRSSVSQMRLRCRAHNQYAAECAFGAAFMQRKRAATKPEAVAARAAHQRTRAEAEQARAEAAANAQAAANAHAAAEQARALTREWEDAERAMQEVLPWLRQLGFRADEARRAAALGGASPGAPLEERVRLALSHLAPGSARRTVSVASGRV